jgi:hypothetical protein
VKEFFPKVASGQVTEEKYLATNAFLWELTNFLEVFLNKFFRFTRDIAQA